VVLIFAKWHGKYSALKKYNKIPRADIHIRVRGGIVQIPIEQTRVRTVVPIPANVGNRAP
jgi:hypothetical protein